MAATSIKGTYSLDVESVRELNRLAQRWQTSKSDALRRAIRAAARTPESRRRPNTRALAVLDALQKAFVGREGELERWNEEMRAERRASGARVRRDDRRSRPR